MSAPSTPAISIRRCTGADAAALAELGARLFTEAYGPTHPEPELSRYLSRSFSVDGVRDAIISPDVTMLLAEEGSEAVGYAYMRDTSAPPPGVQGRQPREIVRFYVDGARHRRGIGAALMEKCFDDAKRRGADVVWLQVWKEAPWAVGFYVRAGFSIVGCAPFYFGDQVGDDHVMAKRV